MLSKAPYNIPSATDFLPSYIRLFMNFARITSPNLASGMTSRFSARWRRDMDSFLFLHRYPGSLRPGRLSLKRKSLRPLCSVYGTALLAVFDALRVEHTAQ